MKPIIVDLGWDDNKRDWCGKLFMIAFVYAFSGYNYIIKGMSKDVDIYLKENFRFTSMVVNRTLWQNGCRCSSWDSNCCIYFFERKNLPGHKKFEITIYDRKGAKKPISRLLVRRVPRRWLDCYNKAYFDPKI